MKRICIILTALLCLPLASAAQHDGIIGMYFDEEGLIDCLDSTTLPPFTMFHMYLVLTEPSFDALTGFEVGHTVSGDFQLNLNTIFLHPQALNIGPPDNLIVGYGEPVILGPATALVDFTMMNAQTEPAETCWRVHGTEPSSHPDHYPVAVTPEGEFKTLVPLYGFDAPCQARLEPEGCIVTTSSPTWDNLKSLYR